MDELQARQRLKDDFEFYARNCLYIRPKEGAIVPLRINRAQSHLHAELESQRVKTGRVRAIVLKGRQQGCSTYVEGRFYWRVTHMKGARAFILTHEADATNNLFDMVERYHDNCPPFIKMQTGVSNAKELRFSLIDAGYKVGTAGNKSVGRSQTNQFFHGSEVAFWENTDEHTKGILQTVPDMDGTEVILESTANGVGNYFHQIWRDAELGKSDYIAIFIPWYWQDEYTRPVPDDFEKTPEESALAEQFGLTDGQLVWRRAKIINFAAQGRDGDKAFQQEYPCCAAEAFQMSGDSLIPPDIVIKARKTVVKPSGPLIVGIDPAFGGRDRTVFIRRRGRFAYKMEIYNDLEPMTFVGKVIEIIKNEKPVKVFIDISGSTGHVDRLRELGYGNIVIGIAFGGKPLYPEKYPNKRSEMWVEMKNWFYDEPVQIPDSDILHADICAPGTDKALDSKGRVKIETKESLEDRGLRSPDCGDALALTFAYPVRQDESGPLYPQLSIV